MTKRVVQEMGEDSMVCQEKCESMRLLSPDFWSCQPKTARIEQEAAVKCK
jgi:hypothetical protein